MTTVTAVTFNHSKRKLTMSNSFTKLRTLNVNDRVEKKEGLTYLSWAWAWDEFKQACPDATYEVIKTADGLPYFESAAGAMVYTKVTAEGQTHEMWLPVMDSKNKAMKREPYTYKTRQGDKTVEAFTMFDVNKTIMRCLVKNLAMFGLALYIYAGEDLPEAGEPEPIDLDALLIPIQQAADMDTLRKVYVAGVKAVGNNQDALKILESAKDIRKNELSIPQGDSNAN
jgi:hypothetical protein